MSDLQSDLENREEGVVPVQKDIGRKQSLLERDVREAGRQAMWECYHYSVNRQDRKLTIRNIIGFGFSAREAIEHVKSCEREG